MKTSYIYIILILFGILLVVPGILLRSNEVTSGNSYGVEYNLGWDNKITLPASESQIKKVENIDFYEEDQELEEWMLEPETWKVNSRETDIDNRKVDTGELSQAHSSWIHIEITAKI